MIKIRNLLVAFLLVLVAPILVACNQEEDLPLNWDDRIPVSYILLDNESKIIPLPMGKEYQLKYNLMPAEANNKTVKFTSSNPNVATVDNEGNVKAVGAGSCNITITSQDNANALSATAVVRVVGSRETLSAPTNIKYDGSRLTWDAVKSTSSQEFAPKYELILKKDGVELDPIKTSATYYTDLGVGAYSATLQALGDDGQILYADSALSPEFNFAKIGTPTDLKITALGDPSVDAVRTYQMSFELAKNTDSIEDYEYRITPVSGDTVSSSQQSLWAEAIAAAEVKDGRAVFNIPSTIAADPVFVVFKAKEDKINNIYGSGFGNVVQIGKLATPKNLHVYSTSSSSVNAKRLTWDSVVYADKYKVEVVCKDADDVATTLTAIIDAYGISSFDLTEIEGSEIIDASESYDVFLYALGTSETNFVYIDSASSTCAKQQLSAISGEIIIDPNPSENCFVISWGKVKNAAGYKVYISNNSEDYLTQSDTIFYDLKGEESTKIQLSYDLTSGGRPVWNIGDNYIKIVAQADTLNGSNYENSPVRTAIQKLIKLETPTLEVSYGELVWNAVDNAAEYTLVIGGQTYKFESAQNKLSYNYEPKSADFIDGKNAEAYLYVTDVDSKYVIKSQDTPKLMLTRYGTIATECLSIDDGALNWKNDQGLTVDTQGNTLATDSVEIKISRTESKEEVTTFTAGGGSISLTETLSKIEDGDGFYSICIRAVNPNRSGTTDINGNWSAEIKTYQMQAPEGLGVVDGVLTWKPVTDENVGAANAAIRYIIKLGEAELTDTNLGIESTSTILQNLAGNTSYNVSIQTKVLSSVAANGGSIKVNGRDDTYLINSEFSKPVRVKQLTKPMDLDVRASTLSWSASSVSINRYTVSLYKEGESVAMAVEDNFEPQNAISPSLDFSVMFGDYFVTSGNYRFVVQAWGDNESSLTSYPSEGIEICKLANPEIDVSSKGVITWGDSYSTLDGVAVRINKFYVVITNNTTKESINFKTDSTSTTLAEVAPKNWLGNDNSLTISVQALNNNTPKVYSSNTTTYVRNTDDLEDDIVKVVKLPTVDTSTFAVSNNAITWSSGSYNHAGNDGYNIVIYQETLTGKRQVIVETQVDSTSDGGSYSINSSWVGGDYFVTVQQVGYQIGGKILEDQPAEYTRYLTSEFSEAVCITRFSEPSGVYMSADALDAPVINWSVNNESPDSMYKITLKRFVDGVEIANLVYHVNYDILAGGKYELNLFTENAVNYKEDKQPYHNLKEINDGKYFGEYQIYINTVSRLEGDTPITSVEKDGKTFLLMDSRISKRQSMVVYEAPSINVVGDSIKISNPNASSRGVRLEFEELVLGNDNSLTVKENGRKFYANLSATQEFYEITEEVIETTGVWFQVRTTAMGNSANLVTSPTVLSDVVVSKFAKLTPNTTAATLDGATGFATNTNDFNGWFVTEGSVAWNDIAGATGYRIYLTANNATKLVAERSANMDGLYKELLTDLSFMTNYGAFQMHFEIVGGETSRGPALTRDGKSVTTGYISSDMSDKVWVNKLYAPNRNFEDKAFDLSVYKPNGTFELKEGINRAGAYSRINESGEFDFGVRESEDEGKWVDDSGATKYMVEVQGQPQPIYFDLNSSTPQYFTASEIFRGTTSNAIFTLSIYSIGNTWYGDDLSSPIYLTSDAESTFNLLYIGQVQDLRVEDGKIQFATEVSNTINKYDLKYTLNNSATEQMIQLENKEYDFAGNSDVKGQTLNNIYVRFAGNKTTGGSTNLEGYVNTEWNSIPLNNVSKLSDIGFKDNNSTQRLYINTFGQLAWNMGDALTELNSTLSEADKLSLNITRTVKLGQNVVQAATKEPVLLSSLVYNVPRVADQTGDSTETYIYEIEAQVAGTYNAIMAGQNVNTIFLNSDTYAFSAGKLNTPLSFTYDSINGGVRIAWDLTGCDISITDDSDIEKSIAADQIMLNYTLDNGQTFETKMVDANFYKDIEKSVEGKTIGGMPLWTLGTYAQMSMVVLNKEGLAFGSASIELDVERMVFNHFAAGTGTRNDPFIIETLDHFTNMFWLPELYFRMASDLRLPELSVLKETYTDATNNIPYPAPFYNQNSEIEFKYRALSLKGGLNGNGHKITNYQEKGGSSFYIFATLFGSEQEQLMVDGSPYVDTEFKDFGGIISNLTVEVNTLDISKVIGIYNGILVGNNYGVIENCHILGDDNKLLEGNRMPVVEGKFKQTNADVPNYFFGAIAGLVAAQKMIVDTKNDSQGEQITLFKKHFVGRIENCTNMLDFEIENEDKNANIYVGGIAGLNNGGYIVNCQNGEYNADTSKNRGNIKGYWTGGIVAQNLGTTFNEPDKNTALGYSPVMYYSYLSGCINYGNITSRSILDESGSVVACVTGGITSAVSNGYVVNSANYGTVSADSAVAILGGIVGMGSSGAYIVNVLNNGYVQYNKYTDLTGQTQTLASFGQIAGGLSSATLFNYATSLNYNRVIDNSISADTIDSTSSVVFGGPTEGNAVSGGSFSGNLKVYSAETLSQGKINSSSILIESTTIYVAFVNSNNQISQFTFDGTRNIWTLEWVPANPATSFDPTEIVYEDDEETTEPDEGQEPTE